MKQMGKRVVSLAIMLCIALGANIAYTQAYAVEFRENTSDSPVVMTINGSEVKADEFATYVLYMMQVTAQQIYANYGIANVWDDPQIAGMFGPGLPDNARMQVMFLHLAQQKFEDAGLSLTALDKKQLSDQRRASIKTFGGKKAYLENLQQFGFTDQSYNNFMVNALCFTKLNEYYFGENGAAVPEKEEMLAYFKENYIAAKHILIKTVDGQGNALRTDEEAKAEAQKALDRVGGGEDFDAVMNELSEDEGLAGNPDGYIFTDGDMTPPFYEGAKALSEGEVSGLVKTDFGYHIIKRVPIDYEGQLDNYRALLTTGMGGVGDIDAMMNQWMSEADVQTTEEYDKVTYETAYDYAGMPKPVSQADGAAPTDSGEDAPTEGAGGAE